MIREAECAVTVTRHPILRWMVVTIVLMASLLLASCSAATPPPQKVKPAKLEPVGNSDLKRVILTEKAAQRIGIDTYTIDAKRTEQSTGSEEEAFFDTTNLEAGSEEVVPQTGASEKVEGKAAEVKEKPQNIPYAAVIYDVNGDTWVYVNTGPLTFVRQKVKVEHISGGQAILSEKLPAGTKVVTTGVVELYGAETGVGK